MAPARTELNILFSAPPPPDDGPALEKLLFTAYNNIVEYLQINASLGEKQG
jgi:hypothetical protein